MGKEGIIPCGLNVLPSNFIRNVGDRDTSSEPIDHKHDSDMTHIKAPSSTTVRKIFFEHEFMM